MSCRVLVDGDPLSSRWLQDTLEAVGCEVLLATGEVALDLQDSHQFDLVLTEHRLRGRGRHSSLWRLQATPPALPISIMATEEAIRSIVQGMRLGAEDGQARPLRPSLLLDAIECARARSPRAGTLRESRA